MRLIIHIISRCDLTKRHMLLSKTFFLTQKRDGHVFSFAIKLHFKWDNSVYKYGFGKFKSMCWLLAYTMPTRRWIDVVLMLGHRLRRWPNIKTTSVQRFVFHGSSLRFIRHPAPRGLREDTDKNSSINPLNSSEGLQWAADKSKV